MVDQPLPQGASFAFDNAAKALDEQLGRIDSLDAKAGILLAADGVLAGLLFARNSLVFQAPRALGAAVTIFLLFSILLALLAFSTRKYEMAPTPETVIGLMDQGGDGWLKWRFLGNVIVALRINRSKLEQKARRLSSAIWLLFIVVLLLGGYLTYLLANGVGG